MPRLLIPIGLAGLALGCVGGPQQQPQGGRTTQPEYLPKATTITPACFATAPESISLAMIRERVRGGKIKFDPVLFAADSQIVDITPPPSRAKRAGRPAPRPKAQLVQAVIEPEEHAWFVEMDSVQAHGWSCIIAQIRTAREVAAGNLRLGPWNTWWLVRYEGKAWESTYVADNDKLDAPRSRPHRRMYPKPHAGHHWNQSIARFHHSDLFTWGVCGDMCCSSPVGEQ